MSLESATYISGLDSTNPLAGDQIKQGDDHLRLIKSVLQASLPNADKAFYFPDSATKTANYTIVAADMGKRLLADATAGAFNLTLPTLAASDDGWSIWILKSDSSTNAATIVGTVNGVANPTIAEQYQARFVLWSGTAWYMIGARADPSVFVSKDVGAALGPTLDLFRDSASPAVSDFLGTIDFNGRDSAANKQLYARIVSQILDPTTVTEDAIFLFQQVIAGTLTTVLQSSDISWTTALKLILTSTDSMAVAKGTTAQRNGSPTAGDVRYNSTLTGLEYWNGTVWVVLGQQPTVQRLTSGTGATFTPTVGAVRWRIRMMGPGGGGGAAITNAGSAASADASFKVNADATAWTAVKGGLGGTNNGAGGLGGTGGTDGNTGTRVVRIAGNGGVCGNSGANTSGAGGGGALGGAGRGVNSGTAGQAGATNSGSGGSGGADAVGHGGSGGASGEYVEFLVTGMTTATYTVPAGGAGGAAGTQAGGDGAAGIIIVEEFYS